MQVATEVAILMTLILTILLKIDLTYHLTPSNKHPSISCSEMNGICPYIDHFRFICHADILILRSRYEDITDTMVGTLLMLNNICLPCSALGYLLYPSTSYLFYVSRLLNLPSDGFFENEMYVGVLEYLSALTMPYTLTDYTPVSRYGVFSARKELALLVAASAKVVGDLDGLNGGGKLTFLKQIDVLSLVPQGSFPPWNIGDFPTRVSALLYAEI